MRKTQVLNNKCLIYLLSLYLLSDYDVELARCETIGISSITAGIAGLITAQKTLNYLLNFNKENNILTIFNVLSTKIDNIKVKNNKECLLNKG